MIIMFTLIEELGPIYQYSPFLNQNPYRNLTDMHYEGVDNVLASINAMWGDPYSQLQDSNWPPTDNSGTPLINPDFVSPFDIAQLTGEYITSNYFPSFDSVFEGLLLDPHAINGFNIALSFDSAPVPPPYPYPAGSTANARNLTDIDPNGYLGPIPVVAGGIPNGAQLPYASHVHQIINAYIDSNFPPGVGTNGINTASNSYRIFGTPATAGPPATPVVPFPFVTSTVAAGAPAGGPCYPLAAVPAPTIVTGAPIGSSVYTSWLNFICNQQTAATTAATPYNESNRAAALLALAILQGSYNYWCQVFWDCQNTSAAGVTPSSPSNGCTFINNLSLLYFASGGANTDGQLPTFSQNYIDWRQIILQSIKGSLLVVVNSLTANNNQLNLSNQDFLIGAVTASISAAVRNFCNQVVVGISSLGAGAGPLTHPPKLPVAGPYKQFDTTKVRVFAAGTTPPRRHKKSN